MKIRLILKIVLNNLGWQIIQSKKELEQFYSKEDPWGYKSNPADIYRKKRILLAIPKYKFARTLDIGCGEGWLTKDLPGKEVIGVDISKKAIKRARQNEKRVKYYYLDVNKQLPSGEFDLILVTGVFYKHYIKKKTLLKIFDLLKSGGYLLTCHIKEWSFFDIPFEKIYEEEFTYRQYIEKLVVYQK